MCALPRIVCMCNCVMKTQEANDESRPSLSLIFLIFADRATDSASLWRTKMAGAAVWVRGGVGAVVAQRA